jgi:hypothetical protein
MPEAYGPRTVIAPDINPKTDLFALRCFRKRHGAPLISPKTASLVGSIGQEWLIESCGAWTATEDDPLAVKMAEGMRSRPEGQITGM